MKKGKNLLLPSDKQAQCCWALANSYAAAALHLRQSNSGEILLPSVFLLLHSLELHFKAYLFSQGVSEKQVRKLGHDLLACIRICKQYGFGQYIKLSWRQLMQIARVNAYYKEKELEYFTPKTKNFKNIDDLLKTVAQVAKANFNPITNKSFSELSKDALQNPCLLTAANASGLG